MSMITSTNSSTNLNNPSLGDASFSSYLMNNFEEKCVQRILSESNKKITKLEEHPDYLGRKKEEEEGEIGVFGAEKYFNGVIDEGTRRTPNVDSARKHHCFQAEGIGLDPMKAKFIHYGTPSVRSESSWNSQSALLRSIIRDPSRRKTKRVQGKSFLSGIGCKCYCSNKDSVEVDQEIGEISFKTGTEKQIKNLPRMKNSFNGKPIFKTWIKDDPFTFPTTNSGVGILPLKIPFQEEDRQSLEVFGSPVLGKRNKILNLEKRIRMLSWDANPAMDEAEFSATCKVNCNDTESDASSDLFEIESLTGKLMNPFLAREVSDTATSGCISPPHCYAPSEASIEWSVITASAADYPAMSDSEERRSSVTTVTSPVKTFSPASNGKTGNNREMQRRRSNSLLGCKSQKAVMVAGDAYKVNEKEIFESRMHQDSDSYMAGKTRFRAETKLAGFESR